MLSRVAIYRALNLPHTERKRLVDVTEIIVVLGAHYIFLVVLTKKGSDNNMHTRLLSLILRDHRHLSQNVKIYTKQVLPTVILFSM